LLTLFLLYLLLAGLRNRIELLNILDLGALLAPDLSLIEKAIALDSIPHFALVPLRTHLHSVYATVVRVESLWGEHLGLRNHFPCQTLGLL
jgi:hypothetical protein